MTTDDSASLDGKADSAAAANLVGAYTFANAGFGQYTALVLEHDGSYFADQRIGCINGPCHPLRITGKWTATKTSLRLGTNVYAMSVSKDKARRIVSLSLALRSGPTFAMKVVPSYCDATSDCAGQPLPLVGCQGMHTYCGPSNACVTTCAQLDPCNHTCSASQECSFCFGKYACIPSGSRC